MSARALLPRSPRVEHPPRLGARLPARGNFSLSGSLRRALARANPVVFTTVAGLAGFFAYFPMHPFRKPFTAATFEAVPGWHFVLDYKIALVLAQVAGYAISKLI